MLGELYGGAVETRIANDLEEFLVWIEDDDALPRTVYEAAFQPSRLNTLRSRNSAAYKGLNILVLREGAVDFFWKAGIQELDAAEVALDIHHIFPRKWCEERAIKPVVFNSILNKTPVSYKANRMIGGNAPSSYLTKIQNHKQVQLDDSQMDEILRTHRIDPHSMRNDDFDGFMSARGIELLKLVERVMGKSVEEEPEGFVQSDSPFDLEEDDT